MRITKSFGPIVQCIFSIELCKKHMLIPIKGPENRSYQNYIHSSKKHSRAGAEPSLFAASKKTFSNFIFYSDTAAVQLSF